MESLAILVPLKAFDVGKSRLRQGGVIAVADLSRALALGVLLAARPRPVYVVCESSDVASFAIECGAQAIETRISGLNEATTHAYRQLSGEYRQLVIAHGDIRDPRGLGAFDPLEGVTVITDAHGTGTNVLALTTGMDFTFRFGRDSAQAHRREARRLGIECHVDYESPWRFDVDEPRDLAG